jgi:hypothetical protein
MIQGIVMERRRHVHANKPMSSTSLRRTLPTQRSVVAWKMSTADVRRWSSSSCRHKFGATIRQCSLPTARRGPKGWRAAKSRSTAVSVHRRAQAHHRFHDGRLVLLPSGTVSLLDCPRAPGTVSVPGSQRRGPIFAVERVAECVHVLHASVYRLAQGGCWRSNETLKSKVP